METRSLIADYLDALTRDLRFDRSLCRRVRDEVEDHLTEAMEADASGTTNEAERRAVERFGPARELAVQFAMVSLTRRAKLTGTLVMLVTLGTFVAMRGRVLSWGPNQALQVSDTLATAITVMRLMFWLGVAIGLAGWVYSARARAAGSVGIAGRRWLRRCLALCSAATLAVIIMVVMDATLVALRVMASASSAGLAIPLLFMTAEIVLAAILTIYLVDVLHRTRSAAALLRP